MMVAVVIIGILMIFIFSLLLVSYTLYASQNKKPSARKNSEAANSLSLAMQTELEQPEAYNESALWKYLRCNILQTTWPYYEPGTSGHGDKEAFRYFTLNYQRIDEFEVNLEESQSGMLGELSGFPGNVEVCMYWELPDDVTNVEKANPSGIEDKTGTKLHMEIICETANQKYVVTNHYVLTQSTDPSSDEKKTLNKLSSDSNYNPYSTTIKSNEKWVWELESRN